jgi:hypothetical protein
MPVARLEAIVRARHDCLDIYLELDSFRGKEVLVVSAGTSACDMFAALALR